MAPSKLDSISIFLTPYSSCAFCKNSILSPGVKLQIAPSSRPCPGGEGGDGGGVKDVVKEEVKEGVEFRV